MKTVSSAFKKTFSIIFVLVLAVNLVSCKSSDKESEYPGPTRPKPEYTDTEALESFPDPEPQLWLEILTAEKKEQGYTTTLYFEQHVTWEENESLHALEEKAHESAILLKLSFYEDFAQIGDLGFTLPAKNTKMKVDVGDIVLVDGNQIMICYGPHEGEYTRLGKIDLVEEAALKEGLRDKGEIVITMHYSIY